jgi:hypothetical protein
LLESKLTYLILFANVLDGVPRHATQQALVDNNDGNISMFLSLPSSESGTDVAVYLTPKKATQSRPPPSTPNVTQPNFTAASQAHSTDDVGPDYVANHLRPYAIRYQKFNVPRDVLARFPPRRGRNSVGWRNKVYYAVIQGYEVGVFYDFWYEIYTTTAARQLTFLAGGT